MEGTLINKVENNKILKGYKFTKIGMPIMLLLLILYIFIGIRRSDIIEFGLMIFGNILFIWSYISYKVKISNNKGMPFIEWWTDKIVFRSSKTGQEREIMINDISNISINLDEISILTEGDKTFEINLDEYIEYDQRMKIKENFAELSKEINHHVIARNEVIST